MASLNQVSIELKVSGEREAERALKNLDKAQKSLDRGIRASVDSSNKNAKSLDRISREAAKAQREMDRLAKAVQQGTLNQSQFHAESNRIAARLRRLGMDKAQSEVIRYKNALLQANEASKLVSSSTAQVATATNQFGGSTQFASRKLNAMGVVTQQAGYQVGDFLVQIQGGTNIFVALGQQLTQLIGTFGIFAKSLRAITIISGLGILVPILTAIGAAFMRTSEAAASFDDELSKIEITISDLRDIHDVLSMSVEELGEKYGNAAASVREYALVEAQLRSAIAKNELKEQLDTIDDTIQSYYRVQDAGRDYLNTLDRIKSDFGVLTYEAREIENALTDIGTATDFESQRKAVENLLSLFREMGVQIDSIPEPVAKMLLDFLKANRTIEEANAIIEALESGLNQSADAADDTAAAVDRIADRARAASQAAYGIFQALRAASMAMGATEAGIAAAQRTAARGAPEMEVRATQAAATREAELTAMGVSGAELTSQVALAFSNEMRRLQSEAAERALYAGFADTGGGGGGGGSGATGFVSMFPELQAAFEQAQELAKAYGEEVKILDSALEQGLITQQEYNSYVAQAQEAYNQSAEAANQYEDIILRMANTTSDAIGQAMMDIVTGTKSASDAFSDMAQIILKKAFELLVINPIINSIFGGSGLDISGFNPLPSILDENANGGVFQGGAKVQAFATGGVVGSPTFFPMANGNVGLMGEAGPEAIMPLKRGKGGRLGVEVSGEQGNVVINQTFAFQANGDDSVKRIIASEAPKIAALTQKQMLDARRRGGVVRDTFA